MGVDTTCTLDDGQMVVGGVIGVNVNVDCEYGTNLENQEEPKLDDFGLQILTNIEHSVQNPPTSTFGRRDLIWVLKFKAHRGKHKDLMKF